MRPGSVSSGSGSGRGNGQAHCSGGARAGSAAARGVQTSQSSRVASLTAARLSHSGRCAFDNPLIATVVCSNRPDCRTVTTFYGEGGRTISYLSAAAVSPTNAYWSPVAASLTRTSERPISAELLFASEGRVLLPGGGGAADAGAGWGGCVLAANAVAAGKVLVPGEDNLQDSAEACCRACSAYVAQDGGPGCNSERGLLPRGRAASLAAAAARGCRPPSHASTEPRTPPHPTPPHPTPTQPGTGVSCPAAAPWPPASAPPLRCPTAPVSCAASSAPT